MRILQLTVMTVCLLSASYADENWSWSSKKDDKSIDAVKIEKRSDNLTENEENQSNETIVEAQGRNFYNNDQEIYSNETAIDDVVDTILFSSREGRALDGNYDQVYADPGVQEALAKGDDIQARNLIKEKLCSLGLMSCDGSQDGPEGKRPLYSNIYAQGPPQRRPGGPPYGPPRPMPPPSKFHGPPRKVGYIGGRPPGPSYHGPYLDSPPPSAQDNSLSFNKPPPGAIIYGSKPPGPVYTGGDAPYNFEHIVGDKIHVEDDHHSSSFNTHSSTFGSSSPGSFASGSGSYGLHGSSFGSSGGLHSAKPAVVPNGLESAASSASNLIAAASAQSLQQHVHHHYHHVNDGGASVKPAVVTVPVPVPVPTGNGLSSQFGSQSIGGFAPISSGYAGGNLGSTAFNAGFNSASHGGLISGSTGFGGVNSGYKPTGGLYGSGGAIKPVSESGLGSYGSSNYGQSTSGIYTGNSGSFHSSNPDYYKKELQTGSSNSDYYKKELQDGSQQYNGLNSYAQQNKYTSSISQFGGQNQYQPAGLNQYQTSGGGGDDYQGFETARQQNVDCICVPINQCPASDRIGRKDDLLLPIDPRNLGKDIEAVNDDSTNSTLIEKSNSDEGSQKVKREAKTSAQKKQADDIDDDDISDTQARLTVGSYFGNNYGNNNLPQTILSLTKRKVLPTFGVSFGLPFTAGAYPLNAFGGRFPAVNPYFGSIGPNGLSLGLININPLASLQVTKNEYGEKLVKPLVNFHVTPSEGIVHKLGSLFKAKTEEILLNAHHQHYHSHTHIPPPPNVYHPHLGSPVIPPYFQPGPSIQPEFYQDGPYYSRFPREQHFHHGEEFVPNIPGIDLGLLNSEFQQNNNYPFYPSAGFDPYQRSYNITSNKISFKDDNTGSGYADSFDYATPVAGQDRLGKQIIFQPENSNQISTKVSGNNKNNYGGGERIIFPDINSVSNRFGKEINFPIENHNQIYTTPTQIPGHNEGGDEIFFPNDRRRKRSLSNVVENDGKIKFEESSGNIKNENVKSIKKRQSYFGGRPTGGFKQCRGYEVCCRTPYRPQQQQPLGRCGTRNAHGITGRIKNPVYVDGDSEYGEYPWQVAILKKDPKESVYVCGGTIIDHQHIITAAHCVKTYQGFDLRVRLGEWDVNHDVEFYPYIERDIISVTVHPEYYAGTLDNDLAILKMDQPIDFNKNPHISPACLPEKFSEFTGARCWTTGWGKDAFGDFGKYQNILKEVDVPIIGQQQCQNQLRQTRLGYNYKLNPGFICAGGEEGKDACKGDGGGPMVCERNGIWQLVGVVSWGIGCGQVNVPGVYVRVSYYLDWINQITRY